MAHITLDTSQIKDEQSFHAVCKELMGFPDFYGMNWDAWIDCLTYLDEGDGMSKFHLREGESLSVEVKDTEAFTKRLPDVFHMLIVCTADINKRYIEDGKPPMLALLFC